MRVAYLSSQAIPDTLPPTLQALQFSDALAASGHIVDLVTPKSDGRNTVAGILGRAPSPNLHFHSLTDHRRRWYFPSPSGRPYRAQAIAWLKAHRVDAIYLRDLKLAAAVFRAGIERPVFFETHELFAQSFREHRGDLNFRGRRKLAALAARESGVYRRATGVVAITKALEDDIRSHYGIDTPMLVAPDGVDLELASRASPGASALGCRATVLYLGSLHRWKGVETLVCAAAECASTTPLGDPCAEIWVAGGSPERIAELRRQAAISAPGARICFLGKIPPGERFKLIAQAEICALPLSRTSIGSRYTSPLKLFEYMAMGKAIVASDHPSVREVLTHEENALLVSPEDPRALAVALKHLATHPEVRARLGVNARRLAKRYSWWARAESVARWMASRIETANA
jgi:glycosyltransferase involved in cell wall biosynthesis